MFDVWLNQAPTLGRRVFIIDPQLLNLCLWTAGCYTPGLDALEDLIASQPELSMLYSAVNGLHIVDIASFCPNTVDFVVPNFVKSYDLRIRSVVFSGSKIVPVFYSYRIVSSSRYSPRVSLRS